jgi:hypothetical protein
MHRKLVIAQGDSLETHGLWQCDPFLHLHMQHMMMRAALQAASGSRFWLCPAPIPRLTAAFLRVPSPQARVSGWLPPGHCGPACQLIAAAAGSAGGWLAWLSWLCTTWRQWVSVRLPARTCEGRGSRLAGRECGKQRACRVAIWKASSVQRGPGSEGCPAQERQCCKHGQEHRALVHGQRQQRQPGLHRSLPQSNAGVGAALCSAAWSALPDRPLQAACLLQHSCQNANVGACAHGLTGPARGAHGMPRQPMSGGGTL